jgi:hypothetical protein
MKSLEHGPTVNDIRQTLGYFEPNPYLRMGEMDSGHGVLFGRIADIGEVAVKPFSKAPRAHAEKSSLEKVESLGFDALEPLAVATGGIATYLITQHRSNLRPLSHVDWEANIASPRLKRVIVPSLNQAAETAASWHNAGITHGDMQAKNMVYDRDGKSVFVDAEKTRISSSAAANTANAHKDLALLSQSALHGGLLQDRSARYRAGFVDEHFVTPYLELAKPEKFVLEPQARREAINEWMLTFMQTKDKMPSFHLAGVSTGIKPKA